MASAVPSSSYLEQVANSLEDDFKDRPSLIKAGNAMLTFLATVPPDQSSSLSLGALRTIVKRFGNVALAAPELIELANYFVGGRARLLDMLFFFNDEDAEAIYPISFETMKASWSGAPFYHPLIKNAEVKDYESKVFINYKPSQLAEQVFCKIQQEKQG